MVELARQPEGVPLQSREIAVRQDIPQAYLDQLLVMLRRAGLVKSVRGAGGGYLLGQPATGLSVADILRPLSSDLFGDRWVAEDSSTGNAVFRKALDAAIAVLTDVRLSDLVAAEDTQRAAQTYMMHI
jgi:Rrf2 family cysteine metabolism transcriptional repressor